MGNGGYAFFRYGFGFARMGSAKWVFECSPQVTTGLHHGYPILLCEDTELRAFGARSMTKIIPSRQNLCYHCGKRRDARGFG